MGFSPVANRTARKPASSRNPANRWASLGTGKCLASIATQPTQTAPPAAASPDQPQPYQQPHQARIAEPEAHVAAIKSKMQKLPL
ncbi:hypothetical protein AXE65_12790 [Ventosimonas gracilis]|uniref:Uncharacterized protein n=1 Tax=Ventosimonas gracilis TaxID=1680762 RepID=A0A139SVC2_9GAMM|nr:hypothetical protein AXE65_12790 [Ventosimonas gracilis]